MYIRLTFTGKKTLKVIKTVFVEVSTPRKSLISNVATKMKKLTYINIVQKHVHTRLKKGMVKTENVIITVTQVC